MALWVGQTTSSARVLKKSARAGSRILTITERTPKLFWAICPMTMLELSPSVVTTTASASSMPAVRRSWMSIPWPTWNSPVQSSPSRPRASSFSSITLTSQPAALSCSETALPTRPHPTTSTFTGSQRSRAAPRAVSSRECELLVEHPLRERDDEHLAGRLAQDEVDGRREEARLPAPARRGAEHDQVGTRLARVHDDRLADRTRAHRLGFHVDAELGPERACLPERGGRPCLGIGHRGVERELRRDQP